MRQLADPLPAAPRATIDSARGTVTARGRSRSGGPRDDLGATKSAADEIGPPREPV
jgi:hypothetical protein